MANTDKAIAAMFWLPELIPKSAGTSANTTMQIAATTPKTPNSTTATENTILMR